MYAADQHLILSPSDLNGYVQCRHLTALDLARMRGEIERPSSAPDPIAVLLSQKGDEHERAHLERLRADGREIVEISGPDPGLEGLRAAADATAEAIRAAPDVIYQATFAQPGAGASGQPTIYRGHADFLFRVDGRPSDLGDHSYEVADAKLARRAKPYFLLQLCFYSELLHSVQGGALPERVHVVLGSGETEGFRLAEFSAYFRRVRERFLASLSAPSATYPEPCAHCQVCPWLARCDAQRADDDHLSLVAGIPGGQRAKLSAAGITTLADLATLADDSSVAGIRPEQLAKRRQQAALQLRTREGDGAEPAMALLAPAPDRGFARLPAPSDGDVFFDLEGDPFFEGGLEYLWGFVTNDGAEPEFTAWWGRDHGEEREAFERFVDFVSERRREWPDLHVYHYASYEITVLKRLAGAYGSREEEVDQLLRDRVFVDLYRVVVEAMRIGMPSYSLKKVEAFYMEQRDTAVTDGNDSVIEFERWLEQGGSEGGDDEILDAIAAYNRDDCLSTLRLRHWLLEQRATAAAEFGGEIPWFNPELRERSEEAVAITGETGRLVAALTEGVPDRSEDRDAEQQARTLLAYALEYHQREARPVWWAIFDRAAGEPGDLVDDAECVAELEPDPERPSELDKKSRIHHLRFPVQETKLGAGKEPWDQATLAPAGKIVALDVQAGRLALRRGPSLAAVPLPRALMPGRPFDTREQRQALRRLADEVLADALDGAGSHRACRDLLLARPPRIDEVASGQPLYAGSPDLAASKALVAAMRDTCLVVQGPPGSGKTWTGARLIVDLIDRGMRVGVTSTSHKVIHNMLDEIEEVATEQRVSFHGLKKRSADNPESHYESTHIASSTSNSALVDPGISLPAGTAWHFAREETDGTLDYLFIDEAGQVALADALALGTAARNMVLLGDPQQLPQVNQGGHPEGSAVSALEHVLGSDQTIPAERGVFLDHTWRMHPDVCEFCSELMYDGRLHAAPGRELQRLAAPGSILDGTGLRWVPVAHEGNAQRSIEEAHTIAAMVAELDGASYVDCDGAEHRLAREDILVVTPYNAQVQCLESVLPPGSRIGTVDKFQGQEAQVVFFSLATSSGAEIPRSLEFLLSRNRLNVAVSRARCVATVVGSPGLLEIDCGTVEQMRLVNALCRVVEVGGDVSS